MIMPFINLKTSAKISAENEETLRKEFGKIITLIPGKTEAWLMLNFEDKCRMAFKGTADQDTAYVNVELLGGTTNEVYDKLTRAICDTVSKELGVPYDRIYVKYEETEHWGFAGENF